MHKRSVCAVGLMVLVLTWSMVLAASPAVPNAPASAPTSNLSRSTSDWGNAVASPGQPGRGRQYSLSWVSKATIPEAVSRTTGAWDNNGKFHLVCGNCQTHTSHPWEQVYDPVANSWAQGLRCPAATPGVDTGLHNLDCIGIGNKIYVGGGSHGGALFYDSLSVINADDSTWTTLAAMPIASLIYYKFAAAGGKVYMFGGAVGGTTMSNATWQYDPSGGWTQEANMTTALRDVMTAAVGDTVYVMGGYDGSTAYSNVYKYSVSGNTYTAGTAMPAARWWGRAVVYTDPSLGPTIYVMGGYDASSNITNTVYTYTVNTGVWGTETSMLLTLRSHAAAISSTGQIFVAGGYSGAIQNACEMAIAAPASGTDVGVSAITAPGAHFVPGTPATPAGVVRNFGTTPQSNIPVTCWIDSSGTHVYNQNAMVPGPLAPESTAAVSFSPDWTPGNNPYYTVVMFTSLSGDTTHNNDTMKLTTTQGWMPITPNPEGIDRIVSATVYDPVNDHIYMIGGNPAGNTGTYVSSNDMYDPTAGTWASKTQMPESLGWEPGAYCRGNIYYLGGHNNASVVVTTNNIYNIGTDAWSTGTAVPRGRLADMEVTWRDSLIYCLGGWDGASSSGLTTVDIYDPFADAWLSGTALPTDMDMGGAGIIGDTIYIVSAVNRSLGTALANLYKGYIDPTNPTSITWIMGPAFGSPTCITGATVLGPRVYWFGGFVNATTPTDAGWYYDQTTGAISSFVPYMGTISRNQWVCGRPMSGAVSELYGMAGDSACDWTTPNQGYYKLTVPNVVVGVSETKPVMNIVPAGILSAAEPNPFHGRTLVNYSLAKPGDVSLKLYDVTGQLVLTVTNGFVTAGSHTEAIDASKLAHGMYLLRLNTGTTTSIAKLILE